MNVTRRFGKTLAAGSAILTLGLLAASTARAQAGYQNGYNDPNQNQGQYQQQAPPPPGQGQYQDQGQYQQQGPPPDQGQYQNPGQYQQQGPPPDQGGQSDIQANYAPPPIPDWWTVRA